MHQTFLLQQAYGKLRIKKIVVSVKSFPRIHACFIYLTLMLKKYSFVNGRHFKHLVQKILKLIVNTYCTCGIYGIQKSIASYSFYLAIHFSNHIILLPLLPHQPSPHPFQKHFLIRRPNRHPAVSILQQQLIILQQRNPVQRNNKRFMHSHKRTAR